MQPDQILPVQPERESQPAVTPEKTDLPEKQQTPAATEQVQGAGGASPLPVTTNQPQTTTPSSPASTGDQTVTIDPSLAQLPAEDADVIEKVWVEKSDQIIETKKDDPRAEDEAQHNLSRAYLKKRFNLDVN